MDLKELDVGLQGIEKAKTELGKLDYNDPRYDDLEEQLHDLEDEFHDNHGEFLEEVLQSVHDDLCPDNDVLMPFAYLGKGVPVEVDKFPGKDTRLLLLTNPPRIVLVVGVEQKQVVWTGSDK